MISVCQLGYRLARVAKELRLLRIAREEVIEGKNENKGAGLVCSTFRIEGHVSHLYFVSKSLSKFFSVGHVYCKE